MPAMPLLIGYESFMDFWPFCLSGHSGCQRYQTYISICFSQQPVFAGCFIKQVYIIGRSPEIFWYDKMDHMLRLLLQMPGTILSGLKQPNKNVSFGHGNNSSTWPFYLRVKGTILELNEDFWKDWRLLNTFSRNFLKYLGTWILENIKSKNVQWRYDISPRT